MKVMPFFLPVFSFGFPAGLALYWCTQNICRIGTNAYITHNVYKKEHAKEPIETTGQAAESEQGDLGQTSPVLEDAGPKKKAGGALPARCPRTAPPRTGREPVRAGQPRRRPTEDDLE